MYVNEFLTHGANGYVPKSCSVEELLKAIDNVYEKGYYMSEEIREKIAWAYFLQLENKDFEQMALTDKEINVLRLICDGFSSKQMAGKLMIDVNTINYHKKNIFRKTNLKTVGPLVKYAIKHGYTQLL